jgi:16S rRNA (cytosine1402-N4)-methyltransferase
MHLPALLSEVLEYLAIRPDGVYLDATAGLGGHSGAIARKLTTGLVIACDRDPESLALARRNTEAFAERIRYRQARFSDLASVLSKLQIEKVDGLVADLGVSRYQLTDPERGFSLTADGPLDMRMNRTESATAADLVNFTDEKKLADLIYQLGEERRARRIARAIVRARPIRTTLQLAGAVTAAVPRTSKLHPATQTFMALRMAVNDEQGQLDRFLEAAPNLVKTGGRIVVISFMSLDDRKVKTSFKSLAREGRATLLAKHVIRPAREEIENNPASRSAKLRAIVMN